MGTLIKIQLRRGTATEWNTANPVLENSEPGFETDTGRIKYGDGTTAWNSLQYFNDQSEQLTLIAGEIINGDRLLVNISGLAYMFDPSDAAHYRKAVGISKTSATLGNPVEIITNEQIATGLSLTSGDAYFGGSTGTLTNTAPATGISQFIGVALTSTNLLINIQIPITKI